MYSAQKVKKHIEEDGQQCLCLPLDLMKSENCQEIVKKHIETFGKLDILVNNASKQIQSESMEVIDVCRVVLFFFPFCPQFRCCTYDFELKSKGIA